MLNVMFLVSFFLIASCGLVLWRSALGRMLAGRDLLPCRPSPPSPLGFVDVALMFGLWVLMQMLVVGAAIPALGLNLSNLGDATGWQLAWFSIITAVSQLVATGVALGMMFFRYRRVDALGWNLHYLVEDIGIGVRAFVMVVPLILLIQWLLTLVIEYNHATLDMLQKNATGLTIAASWFSAGIAAPICEEIFFRGILQGWLQRLGAGSSATMDQKLAGGWGDEESAFIDNASSPLPVDKKPIKASVPESPAHALEPVANTADDPNPYRPPRHSTGGSGPAIGKGLAHSKSTTLPYWPIFVTALLFGLTHLGQGPAPIPLFLFGLALGYLYRQTGTIVSCIVLHMTLNGFSLFWFTLNVLYGEPEPAAVSGWVNMLNWFS